MDLYNTYQERLLYLEDKFDENKFESLKEMSNLYFELAETNFHDISDAIEIWVYEEGNDDLFQYLVSLRDKTANKLLEIMNDKKRTQGSVL